MSGTSNKIDDTLSRRQMLRSATAAGGAVLLTALCARQAQAGQMTKQAAGYQPTPKGDQRCDGCSLFQEPSSCKFVSGDIAPQGWCRLWQPKKS
ncbi:MAG: hypothetical protein JO261_13145 [Alphaproteobacteria bacterium]|nr:hypothetical protein [Alphaproteobacteria bacterium]MBV9694638.1 hypothetical protein [Alphaproteobacteria bacterium]